MVRIEKYIHNIGKTCIFNSNEICPYCNKAIYPEIKVVNFSNNYNHASCIVSCPACSEEFFIKFRRDETLITYTYDYYEVLPFPKPQINLPADFQELFPEFYKIYLEAAQAESYNLLEICGMGYRKALEALVKQYATELFPEQAEAIQNEMLMPTIKRFASQKIITLATAATWLGNDHAHLVTKHPDYDLNALKSFINVLCQYIQSEKEIEKATALINRAKK